MAVEKGFWGIYAQSGADKGYWEKRNISELLMLCVSELAEAQEALRNNNPKNFNEEIADVFIRLADLCGGLDIDIEKEIIKKMRKNAKRPYKHGKAF